VGGQTFGQTQPRDDVPPAWDAEQKRSEIASWSATAWGQAGQRPAVPAVSAVSGRILSSMVGSEGADIGKPDRTGAAGTQKACSRPGTGQMGRCAT
jgi:hypothetical protein